jgi:hypothetical protein
MTLALHEKAMDELSEYKKLPEDKFTRLLNKMILKVVLQTVDEKVTIQDIDTMHPDDFLELFSLVWKSGRRSGKGFRNTK